MSKNSSNSDLASFVDGLDTISTKEKINETFVTSKDEVSFAGNTIELPEDEAPPVLKKTKLISQQADDDYNANSIPTFRRALNIFSNRFLSFFFTNLILTTLFLVAIFGLLIWKKSSIPDIASAINHPKHEGGLLLTIALTFWIYFSLLRASLLTICSNYFSDTDYHLPILFGLKKLFSFIVLELMQIILFTIGALLVFLAPFYGARYFLAAPIMVEGEDDAVTSMLKSAQIVQSWMLPVFNCMVFISFFSILTIGSSYFGLREFVKDDLILYSLLSFAFIFFVLPIHTCFRFALHKKLQQFVQNQKFDVISKKKKLSFVLSRLIMLTIISFVALLLAVGAANGKKVLSADYLIGKSGISTVFKDILDQTGYSSTNTNN